jgi:7-cyano-7-deazaguanine synthase
MGFIGRSNAKSSPADSTNALILLSGGIDSTACVHFYLSQGLTVEALFIDYGQAAAAQEARAAAAIAAHYHVLLRTLTCKGASQKTAGLIPARNAFLIFAGLLELDSTSGLLALGIHAGTPYFDCSELFLEDAQTLVDGYADGRIRLAAPFLNWQKSQIWDYCLASQVPIDTTYSCELGRQQPCSQCMSCEDLRLLYARAKLTH